MTVRTQHHYDAIGLLQRSARSDAGYRLYPRAQPARLQETVVYRTLGFALDEMQRVFDDPAGDRPPLRRQRRLVVEQAARPQRVLTVIDTTLTAQHEESETPLPALFDGF